MRFLCLSDLHIVDENSSQLNQVKELLEKFNDIDVILITGDIFDTRDLNPYEELSKLNKPIVFCLGNHEFAYSSVHATHNFFFHNYNPNKWNVHCLDILGHYTIGNVNIIGNVLWYDGSLKSFPDQSDKIDSSWLDSTIFQFNYKEENKKCIEQISRSENNPSKNEETGEKIDYTILLTHCVPHVNMNVFTIEKPLSIYNMYSGVDNLFVKIPIKIDYAICGHTHRYAKEDIQGIHCINIGNDYFRYENYLRYYIIDL